MAFTRDGASLITGGFDGSVSRWSTREWTETASKKVHDKSINCGAITSEDHVVTGSTDTTVRLLDADLSTHVQTLTGHGSTVAGLAAHPSEPIVASASYDSTVRIWHLESPPEAVVLTGHPNNVTSVEFFDHGTILVSGGIGDELIVWTLESETEETRLKGHGQAVAGISTHGHDQLWSLGYNGTVFRWSTGDWNVLGSFDLPADATPSGIAVNPYSEAIAVTRDGGILIYDSEGRRIAEHSTSIQGIYTPRWASDGSVLAVGGADGNVRIYDPKPAD